MGGIEGARRLWYNPARFLELTLRLIADYDTKFLVPNFQCRLCADRRLLLLAVCAHANQARTRTFNWEDPANVRYAADVADFARQIGIYTGADAQFSFSDIYDPLTFEGARFCEARVFSFFSAVAAADVKVVYPHCVSL